MVLKQVIWIECFENTTADKCWEVRECSAGFIRKLTKQYPKEMHRWYLKMITSDNLNHRRFASESLRPVADNRWLHKQPEFALSIIKHLFYEPESYARTSVGNNLSDWMRIDEARTFKIIEELAKSNLSTNEAVCFTLMARYYKRIAAHLTNIATSVILPLTDLDYFDERREE